MQNYFLSYKSYVKTRKSLSYQLFLTFSPLIVALLIIAAILGLVEEDQSQPITTLNNANSSLYTEAELFKVKVLNSSAIKKQESRDVLVKENFSPDLLLEQGKALCPYLELGNRSEEYLLGLVTLVLAMDVKVPLEVSEDISRGLIAVVISEKTCDKIEVPVPPTPSK